MKELILNKMIEYNMPDLKRINHALKVYGYAKAIGQRENLDPEQQKILEVSAILHDIGIHKAQEKYGCCLGKYQEELGPEIAKNLLQPLGYTADEIDKICFIIANHHSYHVDGGNVLQYLFEADFIVNTDEDNISKESALIAYKKIFKSKTGSEIFEKLFLN